MNWEEIARDWHPPDGLGYSSLRPVRIRGKGWVLAALSGLLALGGLALGPLLWNRYQDESARKVRLDAEGVAAEATVVRLWRSGSRDHEPNVRYRFEAGQEQSGSAEVPLEIWRAMKVGDRLAVRYVPSAPAINHPAAWQMRVTPWFLAIFVPVMFVSGAIFMVALLRRQIRLLEEGQAAAGMVLSTRRSDKGTVVRYEFRTSRGEVLRGRGVMPRKSAPAEGGVVCVLYDPERPRVNSPYPLPWVKLEGTGG